MADSSATQSEDKGQGASGDASVATRSEHPTQPEGCICTVDWEEDGDFYWYYKTACPVGFRLHPAYRPHLGVVYNLGQGFGGTTGEGTVQIDDGKAAAESQAVVDSGVKWSRKGRDSGRVSRTESRHDSWKEPQVASRRQKERQSRLVVDPNEGQVASTGKG
ncbi:hypothetical protein LX36DRAFT_19562 [Colletotrichum falcatum]|nr:hypothetical protein LX36DRAFT_19562 [Colletotrichum falcatum]